jgi:hypothetical protein
VSGSGEDDTGLDRIANVLGAVADAIHHLAENVADYRKTSEENAGTVAHAIRHVASGGTSGPDGLELLSMAINGSGDPAQSPLSQTIAGAIGDLAEAIRERREGP